MFCAGANAFMASLALGYIWLSHMTISSISIAKTAPFLVINWIVYILLPLKSHISTSLYRAQTGSNKIFIDRECCTFITICGNGWSKAEKLHDLDILLLHKITMVIMYVNWKHTFIFKVISDWLILLDNVISKLT